MDNELIIQRIPNPSGILQQEVLAKVAQLGRCNIFDMQQFFPNQKLISLQRALDFNQHRGWIKVIQRNSSLKIPIGGDLRSLTFYSLSNNIELSEIMKSKKENTNDPKANLRNPQAIEEGARTAIHSRTSLEMVWPKIVSVTIDDDDE